MRGLGQNSHINKVPSEIWSYIFLMSLTRGEKDDLVAPYPTTSPNCLQEAVILASVCSRFRAIVTRSSELWNHIDIRMGSDGNITPSNELIVLALERSSSRPLTLSLEFRFKTIVRKSEEKGTTTRKTPIKYPGQQGCDMMELFVNNIHRAEHLDLDVQAIYNVRDSDGRQIYNMGRILTKAAPLMLSAQIIGRRQPIHNPDRPFSRLDHTRLYPFSNILLKTLQMSPKARSLTFRGDVVYSNVCSSNSPFQHLSDLDVEGPVEPKELLEALQLIPALRRCRVRQIAKIFANQPGIGDVKVTMPQLQVLNVGECYADQTTNNHDSIPLPQLLSYIVAPSLRTLILRRGRGRWLHDHFMAFIKQSGSMLEHLVLDPDRTTEVQMRDILSHLPNLKALEIHTNNVMMASGQQCPYPFLHDTTHWKFSARRSHRPRSSVFASSFDNYASEVYADPEKEFRLGYELKYYWRGDESWEEVFGESRRLWIAENTRSLLDGSY